MSKLKKKEIKQFPKTLIVIPASQGSRAMTAMAEEDTFDILEAHEEVVAKYALVEVCKVKRRVDFKPVKTWELPNLIGPKVLPNVGPSQTKEGKAERRALKSA